MPLVSVSRLPSFGMFRVCSLVFLVACHLLLRSWAQGEERFNRRCQPFECGVLGRVGFPFSNKTTPECGLSLIVDDCNEQVPRIRLGKDGPWFFVPSISQDNTLTLQDNQTFESPRTNCTLKNLTIPIAPYISVEGINQTLFKCPSNNIPQNFASVCSDKQYSFVYPNKSDSEVTTPPLPPKFNNCSPTHFQKHKNEKGIQLLNFYAGWFRLPVTVTEECLGCFQKGGQCDFNKGKFICANVTSAGEGKSRRNLGLRLGVGFGVLAFLIAVLSICIIRCYKKQKHTPPSFNSRFNSYDPSLKSELEGGFDYNGIPIFPYSELAKATNNFNDEKELGDGGFGTVYHAKLQDGREVAVKRLYEHNCKRFEHFMNEIKILTRLRHRNLVSLYGCTSLHSQQGLLLVYEYVPNGTVADHLRGDRSNPGSLSWPTRMKIAIETASALAYLHACDIIHRDVKTNNILLDINFGVKVADFGLSRLFPTDVTHVSTAPQGSPGYVDPEYHQCYQLTDKSDVYSFGVVLIELISSMPAVDMNRHRDEINLANLAVNRIQNCAIEDLIDPFLGYQSDEEVRRMITSVAELAFLCLQHRKEMRPSMDVVLDELTRIEIGEFKLNSLNKEEDDNDGLKSMQQPASPPDCDNAALLKKIRLPSSPISVTSKWISRETTPNVSC